MRRYRFEVWYRTKKMKEANDFLQKCGVTEGQLYTKENGDFDYNGEDKPLDFFKDLLKQAYESIDCEVLKVEGGEWE